MFYSKLRPAVCWILTLLCPRLLSEGLQPHEINQIIEDQAAIQRDVEGSLYSEANPDRKNALKKRARELVNQISTAPPSRREKLQRELSTICGYSASRVLLSIRKSSEQILEHAQEFSAERKNEFLRILDESEAALLDSGDLSVVFLAPSVRNLLRPSQRRAMGFVSLQAFQEAVKQELRMR